MSWSLSYTGHPAPIIAKIKAFSQACSEPEETVKEQLLATVKFALIAYPKDHPVKVTASGSQSPSPVAGEFVNQFQVAVEPMWGFLK